MDANSETFVVHVAIRKWEEMVVDLGKEAQIKAQNRAQVGALLFDEVSIKVLAKYFDYSNIFLAENVEELPEKIGMNEHAIELEEGK